MQISTTRQVVSALSEHSYLYFLYIKVVYLIPLLNYLKRVLGFIKETSIKASYLKEEDMH
jgi:ABC-type uncharacterized transport system involved in gliding motility auxiliary subunit